MRLWTFQDKSNLFESESCSALYKKHLTHECRIKEEDKEYCSTVNGIRTAPIYTFARIFDYPTLCVKTLYQAECNLDRYYHLNFYRDSGMYMYELEVPEKFILSAKYCNVHENVKIVTNDFKKFVRSDSTGEDIECLIPYIDRSWVAAVRKIQYSDKVGYLMCHTIEINKSLFPSWTDLIWLRDNGYPVVKENGVFRTLNIREMDEHCRSIGMPGCPRYYTIKEALTVCDMDTYIEIKEKIDTMGIPKGKYGETLILDLFPNGLRMED